MVRIKLNNPMLQRKPDNDRNLDGAKEIIENIAGEFEKRCRAPRPDARVLPLAADVAAARARGGDAAVPSLAAPS
jgi:hypothetical protein